MIPDSQMTRFDWDALKNSVYLEWKDLKQDQFSIEKLGGLSNYVYKIQVPHLPQCLPVVYKVFSNYFICLMDRDRELQIAKMLERHKQGPIIYYSSESCRIESFLPYSHMPVEEMTKPIRMNAIAHLLSFFHKNKEITLGDPKSPLFIEHLSNPLVSQNVKQAIDRSELEQDQKITLIEMTEFIFSHEMIERVKSSMIKLNSPIVLAHNDTNSTNMLLQQSQDQVYLLDYEYSGYNYRAFEFGNFFNEQLWDYEVKKPPYFALKKDLYPSEDKRISFFLHYIYAGIINTQLTATDLQALYSSPSEDIIAAILKVNSNQFKTEVDIINEVKKLDEEANAGKLLSHIFWFIVAALSLSYKDLDFDCFCYCQIRFQEIQDFIGKV